MISRAVELARKSDVAIVFLGTNLRVEAEGRDRRDLNLPGAQEELLEAVYAANPKTVVVLMNAGPLAVTWANDRLPAILECLVSRGGRAELQLRKFFSVITIRAAIFPTQFMQVSMGCLRKMSTTCRKGSRISISKACLSIHLAMVSAYTQFRYSNL